MVKMGFPGGASGKEPACQCRRHKRHEFDPWVRKIPWRRAWQSTPVFLPGESHRARSLVGYSPVKVTQLGLTLCDPIDYTVHRILQARILEWVTISFSRGSSWPRNWTGVSCILGRFFTRWVMMESGFACMGIVRKNCIFFVLGILNYHNLFDGSDS